MEKSEAGRGNRSLVGYNHRSDVQGRLHGGDVEGSRATDEQRKHCQGRDQQGSEAGTDLVWVSNSEGADVAGAERTKGEKQDGGNEAPDDKGHQKLWDFSFLVDGMEALGRFCAEEWHESLYVNRVILTDMQRMSPCKEASREAGSRGSGPAGREALRSDEMVWAQCLAGAPTLVPTLC